jgi:hypothetical protein
MKLENLNKEPAVVTADWLIFWENSNLKRGMKNLA